MDSFYAAVRKATPQVRALAERYRGDVSFSFDSNGRSVWVVALFGEGAPSALSAVVHKYGDVSPERIGCRSPPFDALRTGPSILRDGPAGLLRRNGTCVSRRCPNTLRDGAEPPRVLRTSGIVAWRAVSKGERIRKDICEMLQLGSSEALGQS